jgi:dimethylsulfone monooxygenase
LPAEQGLEGLCLRPRRGAEVVYLTRVYSLEGQSYGDAELVRTLRTQFALGWGGMTFVGTPEQVVDQLARVSKIGIDGILLGFLDYVVELEHFDRAVMPLLRQAGLRR